MAVPVNWGAPLQGFRAPAKGVGVDSAFGVDTRQVVS